MKEDSKKEVKETFNSNVKKLTALEVEKLTDLQNRKKQIDSQLSQLAKAEIELKAQREFIEVSYKNILQEESKLSNDISSKYGDGSINLQTGEFTSM
jgi:hypothetical protein